MAREINAVTGNYHDLQDQDLFQSIEDRLHVDLGTRLLWTNYGFPANWPQLSDVDLRRAVIAAIGGDEFTDSVAFSMNGADLIVDVQTVARPDY